MSDELSGLNRITLPQISRVLPKKGRERKKDGSGQEFQSHLKDSDKGDSHKDSQGGEALAPRDETSRAASHSPRQGHVLDYEA
jgi:hypothetical protein